MAHGKVAHDGQQIVKKFARNTPAGREAEVDLFIRAVEIASAGFDQPESVGQDRILFHHVGILIAVDHFNAEKAHIQKIFHNTLKLGDDIPTPRHNFSTFEAIGEEKRGIWPFRK